MDRDKEKELIKQVTNKNHIVNLLLQELRMLNEIARHKYFVHPDEYASNRYFLRLSKDQSEVVYGMPSRIIAWLNVRNISHSEVYNMKLFNNN